jgi:hypothetical protein
MALLRFLIWLSLIVWLGGLIFFPVVAQTAFSVLPTRQLAGLVVGRSLGILHWMGIVSGIVFLAASMAHDYFTRGAAHPFALANILVLLMLLLTCGSQFWIIPHMDSLRASLGEIDRAAVDNPLRMQFDSLHGWSTRIEGVVLLLGLVVTYLLSLPSSRN